jgi:hypothetical protein
VAGGFVPHNAGGSGLADSAATSIVSPAAPTNGILPTITGTTTQGQTLSAGAGTWSGASGSVAYQWEDCDSRGANCSPISGATSGTYTLAAADVGHTLVVVVIASNPGGSSSAASIPTGLITARPAATTPAPTPAPTPSAPAVTPPAADNPVPTSQVLAVTTASPPAGLSIDGRGQITLALLCPSSPSGCDASGVLDIALPSTLLSRAVVVSDAATAASGSTVLASFSGEKIASGHSLLVAVRLHPQVLRTLQTLKIRRVKVTLRISNHLTGGPAVNSTEQVYLTVPPLPAAACPVATGHISAASLGTVTLGRTRSRQRRLLSRYTERNAHTDNFCLSGGPGIRVGYATRQILGVTASASRITAETVVLVLTANPFYAIDGIRPGSRLATATRRLKLGRVIHSGRNDWFVIAGSTSNDILKVRQGTVREVGLASRQLTASRSTALAMLRNF